MIYLIEQMKWLLLVGIVVGFFIGWFLYQVTPIIESSRRLQAQRRTNQKLKNDWIQYESQIQTEQTK